MRAIWGGEPSFFCVPIPLSPLLKENSGRPSRLLQLKLKNWAKNIDFFMFLAYFLCFWYVHMKVYMV
ncbi:MAG: hypothetical protein C6W57_07995 [Caldibacillus debilis]|nr:MAG: hypothetical protein C6W57_07995 [Caldibacillus debilis]